MNIPKDADKTGLQIETLCLDGRKFNRLIPHGSCIKTLSKIFSGGAGA
jgi:hypothetical protein